MSRENEENADNVEPARWELDDGVSVDNATTEVRVRVNSGGCVVDTDLTVAMGTEIDRVDLVETADSVTVTAWTRPSNDPRLPDGDAPCLDVGGSLPYTIRLAASLDDRAFVDGWCDTSIIQERRSKLEDDEGLCTPEDRNRRSGSN